MGNILTKEIIEELSPLFKIWSVLVPTSLILVFAVFIFTAYSVFKISKNAGIKLPWLSFIPVVSDFALGRVAEGYVKKNGKPSAKLGIWMLIFRIATMVFLMLLAVFAFNALIEIGGNLSEAKRTGAEFDTNLFSTLIPVFIFYMLGIASAVIREILYYISLYRTYAMLRRKYAALCLVLSILFTVAVPIVLFVLRNKPLKATFAERNQNG